MFQVGLVGHMGSGHEGIQECFGILRNATSHTYKGNGSPPPSPSQIKKLVLFTQLFFGSKLLNFSFLHEHFV